MLFPFGSPNTLGVGALCYVAFAMIAPHVTMGRMYIDMFADIDRARLILIWGKNPAAHCPPDDLPKIEAGPQARGRDNRHRPQEDLAGSLAGRLMDTPRPGTDCALALGMCNVLIEEELYDEAFVT